MRWRGKFAVVGGTAMVAAMFTANVTVRAQSEPGPGPNVFDRRIGPGRGPGPLSPDDVGGLVGFVGIEAGLGRKTVTGAPFTATYSQEVTQTLADGNHIQRTTTGVLGRDISGRTRRDMTLPAIGEWATSGKTPPHVILINDPVAGSDYVLEPDRKTARKMTLVSKLGDSGGGPPPPFARERQNESTTVALGTQIVNGVSAQGSRTTRTIPAGTIGNERPIVITVERWYSPDLQMNVLIRRSDPRTGDNVFQLTNIVREAPDASLFQVPSDYTVKESGEMGSRRKGHLPPPPPQN